MPPDHTREAAIETQNSAAQNGPTNREDPVLHLAEYQREVHRTATEHGWWDEERPVLEAIALIHAELSEAVEDYRKLDGPLTQVYRDDSGKIEGFGVELADAVIRILDLCEHLGIDMEALLLEKNAYNRTRPYRHGGRKA